jgi:LSD1 subclass zinc finger protein
MRLSPVKCTGCAAPLPLAIPAPEVRCPHCSTANALPAAYVEAAALRKREAEARRQAEPLWRALEGGAPTWSRPAALALIVVLPPVATLVAWLIPRLELGAVAVTAAVSLPALLPGAALWVWASAVAGTTLRFKAALAARGDGSTPACRTCGAPLAPEPGALAATCGYCGSDSLLEKIPVSELARSLGEAVTTLEDAARKLRTRRATIGLGAFGLALLVGGSSILLWIALRHVA